MLSHKEWCKKVLLPPNIIWRRQLLLAVKVAFAHPHTYISALITKK
jgi:hypothetical protein